MRTGVSKGRRTFGASVCKRSLVRQALKHAAVCNCSEVTVDAAGWAFGALRCEERLGSIASAVGSLIVHECAGAGGGIAVSVCIR